jgi:hypothetical protein
MTVQFRNLQLKARPRRFKYEHTNKVIETAVNNIHDTRYLYNTWTLSRYFWYTELSRNSRKYLMLDKKVEIQSLEKENSKVQRFKNFKLIYLN